MVVFSGNLSWQTVKNHLNKSKCHLSSGVTSVCLELKIHPRDTSCPGSRYPPWQVKVDLRPVEGFASQQLLATTEMTLPEFFHQQIQMFMVFFQHASLEIQIIDVILGIDWISGWQLHWCLLLLLSLRPKTTFHLNIFSRTQCLAIDFLDAMTPLNGRKHQRLYMTLVYCDYITTTLNYPLLYPLWVSRYV